MPRSRLGPLAIETKLGNPSSSSSVWRAIHVQLKRAIAVKIFAAPFGGTPEARAIFSREWDALKKMQHPAIARCFGGGFEETDAYLAYELVEGETLADQLVRKNRLSWESALDIAEPLADALEFLHSNNVIHGAIEPDKIMIAGLSPVLLDVRMDRRGTPYRTNSPITAAQVALMAPEQQSGEPITASTDIYALGACLYLAITGDPPISGSSIEEIRSNIKFQTPVAPATIVLDCPVWLDKVVMQMLEKDPALRPPHASAVKLALAEVRKRSMSRTGVAEHVSSGFSALQMTDQKQRDEARTLLGRELVDLDEDEAPDATLWHDKAWVLIGTLVLLMGLLAWVAWPSSEISLRQDAEALIAQDTRSALAQAKLQPLRQMLAKFPDGEHADWARDQIDQIDVTLFIHQLSVKIKNNLPITNQGELLHKQAQEYAGIGDTSKALDMYRSIITVLGDDDDYKVAVNAANVQIATLEQSSVKNTEALRIVQRELDEAEQLMSAGRVVEARNILYSLVKLYGDNTDLAPLIEEAQDRLAAKNAGRLTVPKTNESVPEGKQKP
ncbi:serine/threonine-protein kinase [Planctomycetes bacterium K23_9]|uniref:Serine/threonine-protein kinase PknB n=1 Tax=Stieleria marina TaxID=1930275 RepID=A0A517P2T7_9BACT|nr:Serine/threonine-protein kinase PknB [Planctomycetes bacterium K23_9]